VEPEPDETVRDCFAHVFEAEVALRNAIRAGLDDSEAIIVLAHLIDALQQVEVAQNTLMGVDDEEREART
jgi:hypothetical protein